MKILVTGSRGVVGTQLVRQLQEAGHEVWGLDLMHAADEAPFHSHLYGDGRYFRCDVAQYREVARVFDRIGAVEMVYHAAAEFGRWNGEDRYERLWITNAIGTRNILEMQRRWGFKGVYFSSSEVYGDMDGPMHEDRAHGELMNDYALSKWVNERQVVNAGVDAVRVRLFNTYGPGEYHSPYRSVVCRFIYRMLHDQEVRVSRGHRRAHTWLPDCVRALAALADRFVPGMVYNIGSLHDHSIDHLARLVRRMVGAGSIRIVTGEAHTTVAKHIDVGRAVRDLGFKETVLLEEGLRDTVKWMREVYHV